MHHEVLAAAVVVAVIIIIMTTTTTNLFLKKNQTQLGLKTTLCSFPGISHFSFFRCRA